MAPLQQKRIAAVAKGFLNFFLISLNIGDVSLVMPRPAEKVAEFAIGNTNVGGVYIPVDLPGYLTVRHLYFTQFVRRIHQIRRTGMVIQKNALILAQKFKLQGA